MASQLVGFGRDPFTFSRLVPVPSRAESIPNREFLPVQGTKAIRLVLNRFETGELRLGSIRVTALSITTALPIFPSLAYLLVA